MMKRVVSITTAFVLAIGFSVAGRALADQTADLYVMVLANTGETSAIRQSERIEFSVVYRNNGPAAATGVKVVDVYAQWNRLTDFSLPPGCEDTGRKIVCTIGYVEAGAQGSFSYSAQVKMGADTGSANSYFTISSNQTDPDTGDNRAAVRYEITPFSEMASQQKAPRENWLTKEFKQQRKMPADNAKKKSALTVAEEVIVDAPIGSVHAAYIETESSKGESGEFATESQPVEVEPVPNRIETQDEPPNQSGELNGPERPQNRLETMVDIPQNLDEPIVIGPQLPKEFVRSGSEVWYLILISMVFGGAWTMLTRRRKA